MNHLQALIDGINANLQRERAESQMTLGRMIKRLEELPEDLEIVGFGKLGSYRGYYSDLAFEPDTEPKTVKQLLRECKSAMGKVFIGYKGGEYVMGELTPLWVANYGCCGERLVAINDDGTIEIEEED